MFRRQHVSATNALYDFDVRAAKDILNNSKKELKDEMRREIMEELRELDTSIKADSMSRRVSQRNLRSKAKIEDEKEGENKSKESMRGLSPCVTNFRNPKHFKIQQILANLKLSNLKPASLNTT